MQSIAAPILCARSTLMSESAPAPASFPAPVRETNDLFQTVYVRLKAMASRQRSKSGGPASMSTTELVHEVFLKMGGASGPTFTNALQFFAYAARAMRHVLVDLARRKLNIKDGAELLRVDLSDPATQAMAIDPASALELDAAIRALELDSPRAAQVLELHYFAGLPLQRVADIAGVSPRTVDREWRYARSFLAVRMDNP